MKRWYYGLIGVLLLVAWSMPDSSPDNKNQEISNNKHVFNTPYYSTQSTEFMQKLILPDGRIITSEDNISAKFDNIDIRLLTMAVVKNKYNQLQSTVGMHAEIISQEKVNIRSGKAVLVLIKVIPPVAKEIQNDPNNNKLELWLIAFRPYSQRKDMEIAHTLQVKFNCSPIMAKRKILNISNGWRLP